MPIERARPSTAVGEVIKVAKSCCECGKPYTNIPLMVRNYGTHPKYGNQKWLPDEGGRELCWKCYDSISAHKELIDL